MAQRIIENLAMILLKINEMLTPAKISMAVALPIKNGETSCAIKLAGKATELIP